MVWFQVDDSFHSHPKALAAGNGACGLWARCGSYAAQHLTDGLVPGPVAKMYGSQQERARLVLVGLWHDAEHDCPRCVRPTAGDYMMHDYLDRNRSREKVLADRAAAAGRQRKSRGNGGRDVDRDVTRDSGGDSHDPSPSPSPKGTTSPQERAASRRSPEQPIPADLRLDGEYAATAERHGMSRQAAEAEIERFRAWHEAKGSRFRSWPAAWRTWVLRWKERQPGQGELDEPEWGR